jgi:cell division protein FtsI/penicillin-binding protein 2
VLGYIGRINQKDQERLDDEDKTTNYKGTNYIGKTGLEAVYEDDLHGQVGFEEVETDSGGRAIRSLRRTPPVNGNNLKLALDIRLQEVADKLFGNRRGALVAIDPQTGGVLAFLSKPGFDPNLFIDGIDSQSWAALNSDWQKPMINRALRGTYPPGSTFKPFMSMAALETHSIGMHDVRPAPAFFTCPAPATSSATVTRTATARPIWPRPSRCPVIPSSTSWPGTWASTRLPPPSASSAWAVLPASIWMAKPVACCPPRNGKPSALPATRKNSAAGIRPTW